MNSWLFNILKFEVNDEVYKNKIIIPLTKAMMIIMEDQMEKEIKIMWYDLTMIIRMIDRIKLIGCKDKIKIEEKIRINI